MSAKLTAFQANQTWFVVSLPVGKHAVGCKRVHKVKYNINGTVERYKACLVAKGCIQ